MAELIFNPETEFEIVEEFNFDEMVQRPTEIRFFTYDEQAADFMNKLLPSKGKISKGLIRDAEYQVDSFTRLYKELVKETPDGFVPIQYARPNLLPWVHYINSAGVKIGDAYNWLATWQPLYANAAGTAPNYYIRLLDSLPRSARFYDSVSCRNASSSGFSLAELRSQFHRDSLAAHGLHAFAQGADDFRRHAGEGLEDLRALLPVLVQIAA